MLKSVKYYRYSSDTFKKVPKTSQVSVAHQGVNTGFTGGRSEGKGQQEQSITTGAHSADTQAWNYARALLVSGCSLAPPTSCW